MAQPLNPCINSGPSPGKKKGLQQIYAYISLIKMMLSALNQVLSSFSICTIPKAIILIIIAFLNEAFNKFYGSVTRRHLLLDVNQKVNHLKVYQIYLVFPDGSDGNKSTFNERDLGSVPGLGRSPGEGRATHSSILAQRIPMDRGAWWATVHGVTKSWT